MLNRVIRYIVQFPHLGKDWSLPANDSLKSSLYHTRFSSKSFLTFKNRRHQPRVMPGKIPPALPSALETKIEELIVHSYSALHECESNLRLLTAQFTTLLEAISDAIFIKDAEGRLIIANQMAKQLFNLDNIAWQGKTHQELAAICPELESLHKQCFSDDESAWNAPNRLVSEQHVIEEAGLCREFSVDKAPLFKDNGERKGIIVIGRDITEQRRTEQKLRIADAAMETQEAIVITDANNSILRVNSAFTRLTGYSAEEVIGKTPALLKSGRHESAFYRAMWEELLSTNYWQGEMWDRRKNGEVYPKWLTINAVTDANGHVTHYVAAFTDQSEHRDSEVAIHRLAFYDPLTDLPNRRLFKDRLKLAMTVGSHNHGYCAILLLDLDNFKIINDTKGHGVGDLLLIEVAKRLKACVRQCDVVARLGGDEFVIILENLSEDPDKAALRSEEVGGKILNLLNQSYQLDEQKVRSSASIGINLFQVGTLSRCEELVKHADVAMYAAKHAGRNTLRFFDPDMQASLETRMTLETELHHALELNQFQLYYQIQVDNKRQVLGAEVLLRWAHPRLGLIPPANFIPIAEDTGLILSIGDWVMRSACLQIAAWAINPLTRDLQLAVNVSARQFNQSDFVKQLCKILVQTGANANQLKLELTESLVMNNVNEAIEKMDVLKLLGIRFSMDDFGTGYSSLSCLKKLPLFQLKIDQSFVHDLMTDPSDAAIIQTIIGVAHNLGLNVIAEGVETEEQCELLEILGCLSYQGYLFSKPIPLVEFETLLSRLALPAPKMRTKPSRYRT